MPNTTFAVVTFEFRDAPNENAVKSLLEEVLAAARENAIESCSIEFTWSIDVVDQILD